jgi:hypothetical protein
MAFRKIPDYAFKCATTLPLHVSLMISDIVTSPTVKIVRTCILKHLQPLWNYHFSFPLL